MSVSSFAIHFLFRTRIYAFDSALIIGFFLAILVQNNHIANAEAVAMEIIRAAKIKLYIEIFQNDGRIV